MDHATRASYRNGCRCLSCKAAAARDRRNHTPNVYALAARRRIERLRKRGMSLRAVAAAAGLDVQSVHRIASGMRRWIHVRTEAKLMAVALPDETPAKRLARQVKTLVRAGMSMRAIDRAVGQGKVRERMASTRPTRAVLERIDQLYREA